MNLTHSQRYYVDAFRTKHIALALCFFLSSAMVCAEDPPVAADSIKGGLLSAFLNARATPAPALQCNDQDYPVFGLDIKVFNLGPNINSGYSDYNPVLDKKESFILFTSRRNLDNGETKDVDGQYFEKMMVSRRTDGVFEEAKPITQDDSLFGRIPSSERHESLIFLSYSEDLLITYTDEKLYYSNRIGDFYTEPVEFPKVINKGKWKRHASITEDGKTLYFTTEGVSNVSKNLNLDIWEVQRNDDGSWQRPKKLPDVINSPYNEDSPEISPDGRFLFFSSNRVGGYGGYDVYIAENINGEWQAPKNLCQPINTPADDIYFKLSRNGNYAYYSSNALGGQGNMDLYKVVLDVPSIATCGSYAYGKRNISFNSPFKISFYGNGKEFFWSFGDGSSAVGEVVNHDYAADGDYQVVLYVREKSSQRIVNTVFSKTVRVDSENSSVDILGPDTAQIGNEFHFDGSASYVGGKPATAFYWKVDGQLVSREPEINYSFTRVGRHKIELEVGVLDNRVMELTSACIAREIEVVTPFEYKKAVGAKDGSEGFSFCDFIPDQVLFDMGVVAKENPLNLRNDFIRTWEGEAKSFSAFENDRSPGITLDRVISVSKPRHGSVKVKNANYGLLVYEPQRNFTGYDKFEYTVRSRSGELATATVAVSVMKQTKGMEGQNLSNDEVIIEQLDEPVLIVPLQNDQHALGAKQEILDFSQPNNGAVRQIGLQGILEYTPNASFQGSDAFTYTVEDEEGKLSTASVIIKTKDVSKSKIYANPDMIKMEQGGKVRLKVLENDVYKGKVNIVQVSSPKHGSSRVINPMSGDIYYGADPQFYGTDAFIYTIEDAEGAKSTASVTIVVEKKLTIEKPLVLETEQASPISGFLFDEFGVPSDFEMSSKVIAKNGKVQVIDSRKGIFTYTPDKDFAGFDMFFATIKNPKEDIQVGIIVKVKAEKSLSEKYGVANQSLFINVNGRTVIDIRKFDYNRLSEDQLIIAVREAFDAAEQLDESQIGFSYNKLNKEQYAITYQIQDDNGNLSFGSLVVYPVDELGIPIVTKMVLNSDELKTKINSPASIFPLLNDRHLQQEQMTIVNVSMPYNGTVVNNPSDGSILYVPNLDYTGNDVFTYSVKDASGVMSSNVVNVSVMNEKEYALDAQGFNPKLKAFDYMALTADQAFLSPERLVDATNGMFGMVEVINANTGEFKYTPSAGFAGQDRFSFTTQHSDGNTSLQSVVAVVDVRNEFVEGERQVSERIVAYADEVINFYGLINKIHPLGKEMKVVAASSKQGAMVQILDGAGFVYVPSKDFVGLDQVVLTVMDSDGNLQKNIVTVEINDVYKRLDAAELFFETPVNKPITISLKEASGARMYHDHNGASFGTVELLSEENLLFKYVPRKVGDNDKFSVVIKSTESQLSYIKVNVKTLSEVDVSMGEAKELSFTYNVPLAPGESIVTVSEGKKGKLLANEGKQSLQYQPYAAASGKEEIAVLVKQADGSLAQRKVALVHVPHSRIDEGAILNQRSDVAAGEPVIIYALSSFSDKIRNGLSVEGAKVSGDGQVKVLDPAKGIIEYIPAPGEQNARISYTVKSNDKQKQKVLLNVAIGKNTTSESPIIVETGTDEMASYSYALVDYLKENNLKFVSVSQPKSGELKVVDEKTGMFEFKPVQNSEPVFVLVESVNEKGVITHVPVQLTATPVASYSSMSIAVDGFASTLQNRVSFQEVLGHEPEGKTLVRVTSANASKVSIVDATRGIVAYEPMPGFVGEDVYVYEFSNKNGELFQKEMKVVVRDESIASVSFNQVLAESKKVEKKETNLSQELALVQEASIASIPEDDAATQQAYAAQQARNAQVEKERQALKAKEKAAAEAELAKATAAAEKAKAQELALVEKANQDKLRELEAAEATKQAEAESAAVAKAQAAESEKRAAEQRLAENKAREEAALKTAEEERLKAAQLMREQEMAAQKAKEEKVLAGASKDPGSMDKVVFRNILFDFDKSNLRPLSIEELEKIYSFMQQHPDAELQLDGHADWIGTVEYNLALSERRAKQAYDYLIKRGISEDRLTYQYYGEAIPVAPNANPDGTDSPEGRQLNRRCEFEVREKGTAQIILKF